MRPGFNRVRFDELPIVGIVRGFDRQQVIHVLKAAQAGGLRNLEITMNTAGAVGLITMAANLAGENMNIGAGTVLDERQLEEAVAAGATFIVTPVANEGVIARCGEMKLPVLPGALSPSEIVRAWEQGAFMVKLFPAECVGPGFIRRIEAPLPHIRLMPTGGVNLGTLESYARAGADGYGVGSPLLDPRRVRAGDWAWIEAQCRTFRQKYRLLGKWRCPPKENGARQSTGH